MWWRCCGLRSGDVYPEIGRLLTQAHVSLRDDFEVSWPEADVAVDAAVDAGALGARMIGGGFGGSVLALARSEAAGPVRAAVAEAFARRVLDRAGIPGRDSVGQRAAGGVRVSSR